MIASIVLTVNLMCIVCFLLMVISSLHAYFEKWHNRTEVYKTTLAFFLLSFITSLIVYRAYTYNVTYTVETYSVRRSNYGYIEFESILPISKSTPVKENK